MRFGRRKDDDQDPEAGRHDRPTSRDDIYRPAPRRADDGWDRDWDAADDQPWNRYPVDPWGGVTGAEWAAPGSAWPDTSASRFEPAAPPVPRPAPDRRGSDRPAPDWREPDRREPDRRAAAGSASEPVGTGRRWAPIVIGDAVADFAPRPAPLDQDVYPPDTLCDGWSTPRLTVRLASVRGYAHRSQGSPRQDDAVIAVHPGTETLVFAVADGVGNAALSHIGASLACRAAVRSILTDLDHASGIDSHKALRQAASRMTSYVADVLRRPADAAAVEQLLATTLVFGVVRPRATGVVATLVQVGDTSAWLLRNGRYESALAPKTRADAAFVSSTVRALPQIPDRVQEEHVTVPPDGVLLVGTDGFGDPLGDGSGRVGAAFAEALATPPPLLGLAHVLDFSRETFDDDRTLLAVWPGGGDR